MDSSTLRPVIPSVPFMYEVWTEPLAVLNTATAKRKFERPFRISIQWLSLYALLLCACSHICGFISLSSGALVGLSYWRTNIIDCFHDRNFARLVRECDVDDNNCGSSLPPEPLLLHISVIPVLYIRCDSQECKPHVKRESPVQLWLTLGSRKRESQKG
jgi:hypothetical protein